ncbi:Trimeric autotransporter adhesin [Paraburkholderia tropica]|uniref:ESPR-type extended signal peptide-containing protein n=1 Tax=Paraburkholderia tropica TaxID=92647 RepID=UPI001CAAF034|nr:ESPR-type extended signal peptide-containing protein [Paraburkholderia tropica]CAG9197528.1 Trimeric autotransporter adhesin [Paraburkholderia tropica]
MNKIYRSVWSEKDQTWVAAPETAAARGKSARTLAVVATGAIGIFATFAGSSASAATAGTVGKGSLELCSGASGYAWGNTGGSENLDCSTDGKGTTDGLTFSLNNAGDGKGGYGFGASTARVSGYSNGTLVNYGTTVEIHGTAATSGNDAAVKVFGKTSFDSQVMMTGHKIVGVADGDVTADSKQAVNGSQLYAAQQLIGGQIADVVRYDSSAHDTVTFGGSDAAAPVKLTNVAAGNLSDTSTDAVNGAQLHATNQNVTNLAGDITNINGKLADAVFYDSSAHDTVTLGGADAASPVKLTNLADGAVTASSADAVTGAQLYAVDKKIDSSALHYLSVNSDAGYGNYNNDGATGAYAIAIGSGATTGGYVGVALGTNSDATGDYGVAIGLNALAFGAGDIALGAGASAIEWRDVAIGMGSTASGGSAVSVGSSSSATAYHSVAVGPAAAAIGANSAAFGDGATASGFASLAIGVNALATESLSIALGADAKTASPVATTGATIGDNDYTFAGANPVGTLSIGDTNAERTIINVAAGRLNAESTDAVNGSQLYATIQETGANTTTINNLTYNITHGKVGLVQQDNATSDITVAKETDGANVDFTGTEGARQLVGLANGIASSAAVNVAQMASAGFQFDSTGVVTNQAVTYLPGTIDSGSPHIELNPGVGDSKYFRNTEDRADGLLPVGTRISNVANGILQTDAVNVGQVADIIAELTPGLGGLSLKSAALLGADVNGSSGVDSSGRSSAYQTAAYYSQVAGYANGAGGAAPTDIARALGAGSIAIGSSAYTPAMNAIALGVQAYANAKDAVALGAGSVANQANTVSVGSDGTGAYTAYDADGNSYTAQSQANTRRIVNMAAGQADNDAVNVGQMRSVVSALGGGASINSAGVFVAPSYSVGGSVVNNVGDAIANLDNRVTQNTSALAELSDASNAVSSAQSSTHMAAVNRTLLAATDTTTAGTSTDSSALHYDTDAHDQVTLASTSGGNVKLSGLQNGTLSAASTDAVTGQQLYATNLQVDALNQAVQNISTTGSTAIAVNSANGAASATKAQTIAVGGGAAASGNNATAIGDSSVASGESTVALGRNASATASNAVAVGANSVADRADSVSVGSAGSERQITNVAAGTSGTDAVNMNQMNSALTQQSNTFNQQVQSLQRSINTVEKNAYAGVAAAMAMPNLTPSGPGKTVVAAGGGYYKGSSAAAVAVTYRSANMHWLANVGVAVTNNGDAGARAQVGYEF